MPMERLESGDYSRTPPMRKKSEKPPFHLCFSREQQLGKSDVCASRVDGSLITPKLYSREYENAGNYDVSDTLEKITKGERCSKDINGPSMLTSQSYGWWHEKGIRPSDSQINFHKKTSDFVNFQMKIYAEDHKLKCFKY